MYGVGLGVVDATSNMQAVALEHRYGRPILPSFHGAWTLGGIVGAGYALAAAHLPLGRPALRRRGTAAGRPRRAVPPPRPRRGPRPRDAAVVPWRPIMLVGLAMVLFYMVDTAAQTWGPTYLDDTFDDARPAWSRWRRSPTWSPAGVVRLAGDGLVARYGAVLVLRIGAVVASLALAGRGLRADLAGRRRSASRCSAPASR